MNTLSGVVLMLCACCLTGNVFGAPNVVFDNAETNPSPEEGYQPIKFKDSETNSLHERKLTEESSNSEASVFFPAQAEESATEIKAPEGIVPAPVGGATEGRTFHHFAELHRRVDQTVQSFLYKLFSPFLIHGGYQGEPHHFAQNPYYADAGKGIYRKDVVAQESTLSKVLSPIAKAPQFFVNHPINFKRGIAQLHHAIGKRSVDAGEQKNADGEQNLGELMTIAVRNFREGKTLDKIIPNFEENVGILMRRIFGDLYGSNSNNQAYSNTLYKADAPMRRRPPVTLANLIADFMRQFPALAKLMTPTVSNRKSG